MFNIFKKRVPVIVDPLGDRKKKIKGDFYSLDPVTILDGRKAVILEEVYDNKFRVYTFHGSILEVPQTQVKLDLGEFQEAIIARRKSEEMQQELDELTNRAYKIKNEACKLSKFF